MFPHHLNSIYFDMAFMTIIINPVKKFKYGRHIMRIKSISTVIIMLVLFLSACTVARMELPGELSADTAEMAVTGRQGFNWGKDVTFGDYRLTNVKRGWVSGYSMSIFFYSATEKHRKYSFTLDSPNRSERVDIACVTNASRKELDFSGEGWYLSIDLESDSLTVSDFTIDNELWTIIFAANESTGYLTRGIITDGTRRIDIESTQSLRGTSIDSADEVGYLFRENGRYIGAAENINKGAVFMLNALDGFTKDLLAIASGAIFIYEDVLRRT